MKYELGVKIIPDFAFFSRTFAHNYLNSNLLTAGEHSFTMKKSTMDFDQEARNLWQRLNLDPATKTGSDHWNATDPIWRDPTGGGTIFVGNQTAAQNIKLLRSLGITSVVNCTHGSGRIPNFHEGSLEYYTFPISQWNAYVDVTDASMLEFTKPMFAFIDAAIKKGDSVLVHCLAGAHRAGTTGCACLIHYAGMDVGSAIHSAKKCRPIIDPIGHLPEMLNRLHVARQRLGAGGRK